MDKLTKKHFMILSEVKDNGAKELLDSDKDIKLYWALVRMTNLKKYLPKIILMKAEMVSTDQKNNTYVKFEDVLLLNTSYNKLKAEISAISNDLRKACGQNRIIKWGKLIDDLQKLSAV